MTHARHTFESWLAETMPEVMVDHPGFGYRVHGLPQEPTALVIYRRLVPAPLADLRYVTESFTDDEAARLNGVTERARLVWLVGLVNELTTILAARAAIDHADTFQGVAMHADGHCETVATAPSDQAGDVKYGTG